MKRELTAIGLVILTLIMVSLAIPFTMAEVYQTDTAVDIKQPCFNSGGYCSASTICNISVFNPKNVALVSAGGMTNQGPFHNYTLNSTDLNQSGIYSYCITCVDGAINGSECFEFTINPPGIQPSESRTESITRSIYFFTILSIILLVGGFIIKGFPFKMTLWILGGIFILISINIIFVSLQDEVVNPKIERLFDVITAASFYLYWGAGTMILFIWMITIFSSIMTKKHENKLRKFG